MNIICMFYVAISWLCNTAKIFLRLISTYTGTCLKDLPEAVNDEDKWREGVREIRACCMTWWSWWSLYEYLIWDKTTRQNCSFLANKKIRGSNVVQETPLKEICQFSNLTLFDKVGFWRLCIIFNNVIWCFK